MVFQWPCTWLRAWRRTASTPQGCHVGLGPGLVDKEQTLGIDVTRTRPMGTALFDGDILRSM